MVASGSCFGMDRHVPPVHFITASTIKASKPFYDKFPQRTPRENTPFKRSVARVTSESEEYLLNAY
jgi:biotin synthase-related radical SAM superfamily protein